MIVNFRGREISRGARKLTRTPILIKKKQLMLEFIFFGINLIRFVIKFNWVK
jgi:hypothetical protein